MKSLLAADGTRIAYRAGGRGDVVLFVHGTLASSSDWIFVARLLRDRFTIVTMDRRGRGRSGFGGEPYSIAQEADDIAAVAKATGARRLVAHSYGALCAMTALARGLEAERVVLYEPPVSLPRGAFRDDSRLATEIRTGSHDAAAATFLSAAGATEAELEAVRQSPAWPDLVAAVPSLPRELAEAQEWATPTGPFSTPALLLVGGETTSAVYLDGLPAVASAFPGLRREELPGQKHLGHVLAPQAFAAAVGGFFL